MGKAVLCGSLTGTEFFSSKEFEAIYLALSAGLPWTTA
jgi:hypothetical protein